MTDWYDEQFNEERKPLVDLEFTPKMVDDDEENIEIEDSFEEECLCDTLGIDECPLHAVLAEETDETLD